MVEFTSIQLPLAASKVLKRKKARKSNENPVKRTTTAVVEIPNRPLLVRELVGKASDYLRQALGYSGPSQTTRLAQIQGDIELFLNNQPVREEVPKEDLKKSMDSLRQDLKRVEEGLTKARKIQEATPSYAKVVGKKTTTPSTSPPQPPRQLVNRGPTRDNRLVLITLGDQKKVSFDALDLRNKVNKAL